MKLTKKGIIDTLRVLEEGGTVYQARKVAGITVRRVNELWKRYKETGKIPELGKNIGRPPRPILPEEERMVREAYGKYKVCASRLRQIIHRDYNLDMSHHHIHKILLSAGFSKSKESKDVRRKKWIRYERRHSLTAVHIDWVYNKDLEVYALPVIDDASRKLLALVEVESATTNASIDAMKEALKHGAIQQCITDHGTQFCKGEDDNARFPAFLESNEIKHILCRIKHPQSNGKAEKFGHLYQIHRKSFKTVEEFIHWYNEVRPHMSLKQEILETPEMAYQRKKKEERLYLT